MEFTVPQFIERKPKIIGPLTFEQFIYVGVAGIIVLIIYFSFPFHWFLIFSVLIIGVAASFAFLRVEGRPLPIVFWNFLKFSISTKLYLWEKKQLPARHLVVRREKIPQEKAEEEPGLKIAERSLLKRLAARVMTSFR